MNDPEVQAIMALCRHQEGPFREWCDACQFRAQAAIEHLTVNIQAVIDSIGAVE